ncbi:EAL domain-containing protein [Cohaesibacter celericrescens]|uniref:EAL domain-containing protein n=1 Tax=Cohaesibacter celericrescens TaxID=2067669 RepID=UPI003565BE76
MSIVNYGMRLVDLTEQLSQRSFFVAVQRGLSLALPLIMVGALALLVRFPPFVWLQSFLTDIFGPHLNVMCDNLIAGTFGIASLVALFGFSTVLTDQYIQEHDHRRANPTITAMVVISCFFIIVAPNDDTTLRSALSLSEGLLVALLVAATGGSLFLKLAQLKFLQLPLKASGHDPLVGDVFAIMPAGMLTIFLFAAVKAVFYAIGSDNIAASFDGMLSSLFAGANDNIGFAIGYVFLTQVLWFFGIHGPNLLNSVQDSILIPATNANIDAVVNEAEPLYTFSSQFFDFFVRMGGSGGTLSLILVLLFVSKFTNIRRFALIALFPALCNVNEPLLFGIPLVLNPIYAIPFILTPIVQTVIGYTAIVFDWMPHTSYNTMWTTPALISGYVSTGSFSGVIVQLISLMVGAAIYLPFVKLSERVALQRSKQVLRSLLDKAESQENSQPKHQYINLRGEEGRIAIALANDLEMALEENSDEIYLEYQPQINILNKQVFGAEALLRWNHQQYGRIAPPITVALAEDAGLIDEIGLKILEVACRQRASWYGYVPDDFVISVNVSPKQLLKPDFDRKVLEILMKTGLSPKLLELEITESTALLPEVHAIGALTKLHGLGVKIALDDFGMGHTSLHYLRVLPFDTVKIDKSLTHYSQDNINDHIVKSIVDLGQTLNFKLIIEGIETEEQLDRFCSIGCDQYQGYLFSKPLSVAQFVPFLSKMMPTLSQAFSVGDRAVPELRNGISALETQYHDARSVQDITKVAV